MGKLLAMDGDRSRQISDLRRRVVEIAASIDAIGGGGGDDARRLASRLLHEPTVLMREGKLADEEDIDDVVRRIEGELLSCSRDIGT